MRASEEHRTLAVIALGHHEKALLPEHLSGSDDGIESAKTGVVAGDVLLRYPQGDKVCLHLRRFVVGSPGVVSRHDEGLNLAAGIGVPLGHRQNSTRSRLPDGRR